MENILENELARHMGCMFSERKTTQICAFFQQNLQFYVNFMISLSSTEHFLDQIECIWGFLMYPLFECHGKCPLMSSLIILLF